MRDMKWLIIVEIAFSGERERDIYIERESVRTCMLSESE